jgi:DNA-binding transcriptional LysR family regulator
MSDAPKLDLLHIFVAVAESTSFSAAAQRLGLPKSKVSRAVARLESSLGTQLLHRSTRAVSLTTAGAELLTRVAQPITALRAAISTLPEQQEVPSGELRVTAPNDLAMTFLAEVVARFSVRHPEVRVCAKVTNACVDLVAESVDLALRISGKPLKDSTLLARKLAPVELQLYASPAYLARRGQPDCVEQLGEHDWVGLPALTELLGFAIPPARERVHTNELFFVRETLRNGAGVGVLPSFFAQQDVAAGTLVRVLPQWGEVRGALYLVQPRTQHVPLKVRAFRDFLLEELTARPLAPLAAGDVPAEAPAALQRPRQLPRSGMLQG